MNVTLISSLPPQKGITPYTLELIDALSAHPEIEVDPIGYQSMYPRFMYPGGAPDNASLARCDVGRRIMSWWDPTSWLRAGRAATGDVIHAQWWSWFLAPSYLTLLSTAKRRGLPVIVTVHNARPHELNGWKRVMNSAVIRMADHIIVHSDRNRGPLQDAGVDRDRVSVVPLGVCAAPSVGVGRAAARNKLRIDPDARLVLLPGNIRAYKGTRVLAQALSEMRGHVPNLRAIVAGEVWKGAPDPRKEVEEYGVADITDLRLGFAPDDEFAMLFEAADVVVLPYTHFDAQSAAATHALTAKRALIVSDAGGLPELVRDARAVVRPGDASDLAAKLTRVLTDDQLRSKLESDTATVRRAMSWETVVGRTFDIYCDVLDLRPAVSLPKAA